MYVHSSMHPMHSYYQLEYAYSSQVGSSSMNRTYTRVCILASNTRSTKIVCILQSSMHVLLLYQEYAYYFLLFAQECTSSQYSYSCTSTFEGGKYFRLEADIRVNFRFSPKRDTINLLGVRFRGLAEQNIRFKMMNHNTCPK